MSEGIIKRWVNPITYKRLLRFRHLKRAWYSFLILSFFYIVSLAAEIFCNDRPLYVSFEGESYFPVFFFYPEDTFTGSGRFTRTNYKALNESPIFADNDENYMVFPLIPYGPNEIIDQNSIELPEEVIIRIERQARVGAININSDFNIIRAQQADWFFETEQPLVDLRFSDFYGVPEDLAETIRLRFDNVTAGEYESNIIASGKTINIRMTPYQPRNRPPRSVRLTLTEQLDRQQSTQIVYTPGSDLSDVDDPIWYSLSEDDKHRILDQAERRMADMISPIQINVGDSVFTARFIKEDVNFPFRPVENHPFGIDNAGRDILARVFYGLRTSLNFGLLLVIAAISLGTVAGAIQGYFGGRIDLYAQRFTEIWESLPFLYVLILLGSVYGQSFLLLVIVYGIFNWIGISYYMRAEFLRIRNQPFVEAARCLGIPDRKIILRHILPNALVPLITFFPFLLVSAIGTLAALDYLGFGLPPPSPSWGELLAQAQEVPRWWLIFYPSMVLFLVMLLGVFIGEGVRSAFDPRKHIHLE